MNLRKIDRAFDVWHEQGLLQEAEVAQLREALEESELEDRRGRVVAIVSTLGSVLVGLGVILFVASHWDTMGPLGRSGVLVGAYIATCAAALGTQRQGLHLISESLWFLATLVLGAGIFLIGQIFNFTLTFWEAPFLWFIGALTMGYARRQAIYGWLAVPLGLLALGWLGGGSGWFRDDQLEFLVSDTGLRPLLPILGLALFCIGSGVRNKGAFAFGRSACALWGLLLITLPLVAGTAEPEVVEGLFTTAFTAKQIAILAASGVAIALVAFRGHVSRLPAAASGLLFLVLLALVVPHAGASAVGTVIEDHTIAFVLYIVFVFVLAISASWIGLMERSPGLINAGLIGAATIICIQYFSWSFELLDRSLAFIIGGLVLLGVGYGVERTRRHLLIRMEAA